MARDAAHWRTTNEVDNSDNRIRHIDEHLNFYCGIALLLAAKAIELDRRVPYLSTILDLIELEFYTRDDIRIAETHAISLLKFEFFLPTLLDVLSFYASQGVVFSNDSLKNPVAGLTASHPANKNAIGIDANSFLRSSPLSSRSTQPSNNPSPILEGGSIETMSPKNKLMNHLSGINLSACVAAGTGSADTIIPPKMLNEIVERIEVDLINIAFLAIRGTLFNNYLLMIH